MDSDDATDSIFLTGEETVMESTSTQTNRFMMKTVPFYGPVRCQVKQWIRLLVIVAVR